MRVMALRRSELRVGRLRSRLGGGSGSVELGTGASAELVSGVGRGVVSPWPRASRERMPASGRAFRISEARTAKERPEEPAPWWVMKRGLLAAGGVR